MSRVEDALKLRDIVQQIIDDKLGKDRPRSSYATVVGYNPALGTVSVIYEGDTVAVDIPAGSIYPSEPGQTVRIGGGTGSKVIEDVYGETLADVKTKTAQETADGKNTVNYGNEEPPGTDHSIGDIWFDENNIPHVWNGSEWESVADKRVDTIKAVQDELARDLNDVVENGVGTKTHYTPTQPAIADSKEGDLWFNTSEGGYNEVWIFTNGAWVSAADARLKTLLDAQAELERDIDTAMTSAAGKNKVFYQPTQPSGSDLKDGDLWFNTTSGKNNELKVYSAGAWKLATDSRIDAIKSAQDQLSTDLNAVKTTANSKNTTYYQVTQPSGASLRDGDLWFNTTSGKNNELKVYSGGAWKLATDLRIDAIQTAQTQLSTDLNAVKVTAEGKNRSYYQDTQPSSGVEGDLWFNTAAGKNNELKVYSGGAWKLATDLRIDAIQTTTNSLSTELNTVKETANGKNSITRSTSNPTTPYNGRVDDLWFVMSTLGAGGRVNSQWRWTGSQWLQETITNAVIATLDAAKITTGTLSAARIGANSLTADTVLVAGSLGSTSIRDGAITTSKISVGAITAESGVVASLDAGKITVGTIDAARIGANTITADKVLIGGSRNFVPNGDLTAGSAAGWPSQFTYQTTDTPPDYAAAASISGTTAANWSSIMPRAAVQPGETLVFEAWIKADKPDSRAGIEIRDQSGVFLARSGYFWSSVEGGMGSASYPIHMNGSTVPTTWTKVVSKVTVPPGVTGAIIAAFTPNHSAGTERTATISLAGLKLYTQVGATLIADGAITTSKISVGAITAESGVVASLDAGKIVVGTLDAARIGANTITADKVLIGGARNLVPNGDLSAGSTAGWPSNFIYQATDTPPDYAAAANISGTSGASWSSTMPRTPVNPGETLVFEAWVKADKANSRIFQEVRDQSGAHVSRTGYSWSRIEGGAASGVYPISSYIVPTTWTKIVSSLVIPPGVTSVGLGFFYPNHSAGSERTATISLAGVKLYTQVGATLIGPGAVTTEKIAVGAITAESGVVASLDAGKITVGTIDAARIAANSITTEKILLGEGGNLMPWSQVRAGSTTDPHSTYGTGSAMSIEPANASLNLGPHMRLKGSGTSGVNLSASFRQAPALNFPVNPGDRVVVRFLVYPISTGTVQVQARNYWYSQPAAGAGYVGTVGGAIVTLSSTGLTEVTATATVPANAPYTLPCLSVTGGAEVGIASVDFRVQTPGTLIEPGAITTDKIATGAITAASGIIASIDAGKITVGQMDGSRITANSIQADTVLVSGSIGSTLIRDGAITTAKIAAGAITAESGIIGSLDASKITVGTLSGARLAADAINGMQIIGATIATSTGFPRVQMDTTGLAVYKSSAVRSFFADSSTGDLSLVGDFATDISGRERVYLSNSLWNSIQVTNESGSVSGYSPGSGVRVGSSNKDSVDLYHASNVSSNNVTVNSGMVMGPKPSSAPRGAMLQLARSTPSSGSQWTFGSISAFDASNSQVSSITATGYAGGYVFVRGNRLITLESGSAGAASDGIQFSAPKSYPFTFDGGDPENGISVIRFRSRGRRYASLAYDVPKGVTLETTTSSTDPDLGNVPLTLNGGDLAGAGYPFITLTPGANTIVASAGNVRPLDIRYDGTASTWGVSFRKGTAEWGQVGSPSGSATADFGIVSAAGRDLFLSTVSKSSSLRIKGGTTGNADFLMTADGWNWAGAPTASATANVNMTSGGWIQRTSSSRRYKIMEKPLLESDPDLTLKLLSIEPKSWFDKASADRWAEIDSMKAGGEWTEEMEDTYIPDPLTRIPGVIAEDLDDAGLDMFVEYDANGAPESVLYDRIGVALIEVLKAQDGRIKALEDTLAKMGQVD